MSDPSNQEKIIKLLEDIKVNQEKAFKLQKKSSTKTVYVQFLGLLFSVLMIIWLIYNFGLDRYAY